MTRRTTRAWWCIGVVGALLANAGCGSDSDEISEGRAPDARVPVGDTSAKDSSDGGDGSAARSEAASANDSALVDVMGPDASPDVRADGATDVSADGWVDEDGFSQVRDGAADADSSRGTVDAGGAGDAVEVRDAAPEADGHQGRVDEGVTDVGQPPFDAHDATLDATLDATSDTGADGLAESSVTDVGIAETVDTATRPEVSDTLDSSDAADVANLCVRGCTREGPSLLCAGNAVSWTCDSENTALSQAGCVLNSSLSALRYCCAVELPVCP